jgi:hypothetical protein
MLCATTRPGTRCLTSRSTTRLWPTRPIRRSHKCAAAQDQTKTDSPPEVPTLATPTAEQTTTSSSPAYTFGKEQQAAAYGFLSVTSLAFGAVAFLVPELLLSTAVGGGPATALDVAFTRIAGATMAISAAAEYSVRVSNTLHSDAFVACGGGGGGKARHMHSACGGLMRLTNLSACGTRDRTLWMQTAQRPRGAELCVNRGVQG